MSDSADRRLLRQRLPLVDCGLGAAGHRFATVPDVVGGFEAWSATGLPVVDVGEPLSGELYARPAGKGGSAMGLVQIIGAEEIVRALMNVPDLNIVRSSVEPRGEGRWKVAAYASDEAIDAATALGAEVQVVLSTERDVQHRQQIASTIAQLRTERGEA